MALDWSTIQSEHVRKACELLVAGEANARSKGKGLYVLYGGQSLPAKQVIRLAYCLANEMALDSKLKFASGEGTLNRLRSLGFSVKRQSEGHA
jgi:hypothetical protein